MFETTNDEKQNLLNRMRKANAALRELLLHYGKNPPDRLQYSTASSDVKVVLASVNCQLDLGNQIKAEFAYGTSLLIELPKEAQAKYEVILDRYGLNQTVNQEYLTGGNAP